MPTEQANRRMEKIKTEDMDQVRFESDFVYPNYVKIFADGGPFSATSLLQEPYEESFTGTTDTYGGMNLTQDELLQAFKMFDDWGIGVHVHAMGDGTISEVVAALEQMKKENTNSEVYHKIAHNTMISPEDIERIALLENVNIDFSPPIWYPHAGATPGLIAAIGEERYAKIYPIKTALESGLSVGQGSDWLAANPTPNPFIAIESMVTRKNPFDSLMIGEVNPQEAISLDKAIYVCTLGGAEVLGVQDKLGSIEEGKLADLVILDRNIFEIPVEEIYGTRVLTTVVDGNIVYDRSEDGNEDIATSGLLKRHMK